MSDLTPTPSPWYHSDTLSELATALAKAQAEMVGAEKTAKNYYKRDYADLSDVIKATQDPLAKHGLSIVHLPRPSEPGVFRMESRLLHSSGEWIASEMCGTYKADDPQKLGALFTYFRRFMDAALTRCPQVDDDGEGAKDRSSNGNRAVIEEEPRILDQEQVNTVWSKAEAFCLARQGEANDELKQRCVDKALLILDLKKGDWAIPVEKYKPLCDLIDGWTAEAKKKEEAPAQ